MIHAANRSIAFPFKPLAQHLTVTANCFGHLAHSALRRLFVGPASLHLAERPFALHFLLQHAQRSVDVVVADEDLHTGLPLIIFPSCRGANREAAPNGLPSS